jgi:hypothetical protein
LYLGLGVEPGEQGVAGFAVGEALVEFVAEVPGEPGDFTMMSMF